MNCLKHCLVVGLSLLLAACSTPMPDRSSVAAQSPTPTEADARAFAPPVDLTATIGDSADIDVSWRTIATEPGGNWIEFTTPGADFVKLNAVWPHRTVFRHPRLAPQTQYIYRILPFFGRPTEPVAITTGPAPSDGTTPAEVEGPLKEPPANAAPRRGQKSIRTVFTIAQAAPTGLTAHLSSPTSVDLQWQDRATDEDGYLIEIGSDPNEDFKICALLPPNTTSFKKTQLPPATKCYLRVRAFFYGRPSETASATAP